MGTGHPSVMNLHEIPFGETLGAIHSTKIPTGPTGKSGPPQKVDPIFSKLFRLDQTDPLSFGLKFPEILVEWITPNNVLVSNIIIVISINQILSPAYTNLVATEESGSNKHL